MSQESEAGFSCWPGAARRTGKLAMLAAGWPRPRSRPRRPGRPPGLPAQTTSAP
ncbi:hypothetical protein ACU4GD_06030 [Cupriavidus basilensis]